MIKDKKLLEKCFWIEKRYKYLAAKKPLNFKWLIRFDSSCIEAATFNYNKIISPYNKIEFCFCYSLGAIGSTFSIPPEKIMKIKNISILSPGAHVEDLGKIGKFVDHMMIYKVNISKFLDYLESN